jgi:polyisoprenoid-binding protein YceI
MRAHRASPLSLVSRSISAIVVLFLAGGVWAQEEDPGKNPAVVEVIPWAAGGFKITPGAEGNLVRFESKAPMESFDGSTKTVSGSLMLDPASLGDSLALVVDVDVSTFDTGIKLRNQHMCENHFHTDKFPKSTFRGGKILKGAGTSLLDGKEHEILLEGTLDLHGVQKTIQAPVKLTYSPSTAVVRLSTTFMVKLADYQIPRPQMLFMKLGEDQKVTATLVAAKE